MTDVPNRVASQDDLLLIQREFFRIIRNPLESGSKMRADDATSLFIKPNSGLSAHERLELYAQQYWWRLLRVMRADFKRVRLFLGDEVFSEVVTAYLVQHPSTYPQLKLLGRSFALFIKSCPLLDEYQRGIAADIAAVEVASLEVARATHISPLSIEALHKLGDGITIQLQPFVRIVRLSYAVDCLFREYCEIDDGQELGNAVALEEDILDSSTVQNRAEMASCNYSVAVYRGQGKVDVCRLDEVETCLVQFLKHGQKLQDVCEEVSQCIAELGMEENQKVQLVFAHFAGRGWLGVVEEAEDV